MDTTIKITGLELKTMFLQPHLHLLYYILLGNLLKNNLEMKSPDFPNGYGME